MRYRVTINIRRKGEGYMEGIELKTEHFDSIEDLANFAADFIEDSINDDGGIEEDE